ncbi:hypothetical protein M409DRAFT_21889 [Zasmidium cellare ATCC 36951]|uniref:Pre-rRNA-processing protein TSR2 n=1 Tax=Zasmidium cellare ATCC 36951 TaxID=1080233 RepID=A0A6A6CND4_ZASCE|nr:uncharacterized protein M409DRAFT_21889 [Zasmidium cellare ATCC 36951]KAF2167738.1 hypothetical protein M409DRAFT_21889 [Zasmidium cellare ATCC 36951]
MSTTTAPSGPQPTAPTTNNPSHPTPSQLQTALDNSIWYLLALWQPLHIAVTNTWGGPDSSDKRDWMAGAISDLLTTRPETDQEDLEMFLLQIMQDEFDCNVEDESECEVAMQILGVRRRLGDEGTLEAAVEVERRWNGRGSMKGSVNVQSVNQDVDELGEGDEFVDGDGDEEMGEAEAPALVPVQPKEKAIPEVDEDGFTKVVGKKKR